ncbi:hypothetical protein CS379_15770, partial [Methylobacterium frigidaeris]
LITANYEAAESFIGFGVGLSASYESMKDTSFMTNEHNEVDLSRFHISGLLDEAYDFAWTPSLFDSLEESDIRKLIAFMNGIPRLGLYGELHSFVGDNGLCQTVVDTAYARWKIEMDRTGTFTARELALLANMSEGAVRNAMSDKSAAGLRVVTGVKPAQVDWADAHPWLLARRGFVPTPTRPGQDGVLKERLAAVRTTKELGQLIYVINNILDDEHKHNFEEGSFSTGSSEFEVDRSSGGLPALGWPQDDYDAWINGTYEFDARKATELAKALDLDGPTFAAKALEASLRRDAETEGDRS